MRGYRGPASPGGNKIAGGGQGVSTHSFIGIMSVKSGSDHLLAPHSPHSLPRAHRNTHSSSASAMATMQRVAVVASLSSPGPLHHLRPERASRESAEAGRPATQRTAAQGKAATGHDATVYIYSRDEGGPTGQAAAAFANCMRSLSLLWLGMRHLVTHILLHRLHM